MAESRLWVYTRGGYPEGLKQVTRMPATDLTPWQIQVRVHAAALNPVDIQLMNLSFWSLPFLGYEKGVGCDFAGEVLKVGSEVKRFKKGDHVMGVVLAPGSQTGTLAEVRTFDISKCAIVEKPDTWSWQQAAAIPLVWLTAKTLIECVAPYVDQTKTVVVLGGSSSTGIYSVSLAKERGWSVVTTCSGKNAEFVKSVGADTVIDYTTENVRERIQALGPDAIIDCVGGIECLGIARRYVTIVGDKTSRETMGGPFVYSYNLRMNLRWLMGRLGLGEVYDCVSLELNAGRLEDAKQLSTDKIFIDSEFRIDDLKQALIRLNTGRARGKVVVQISR